MPAPPSHDPDPDLPPEYDFGPGHGGDAVPESGDGRGPGRGSAEAGAGRLRWGRVAVPPVAGPAAGRGTDDARQRALRRVRRSEPPEPIEWGSRQVGRERLRRALTTPVLLGAVLFVIAALAAVGILLVRWQGAGLTALPPDSAAEPGESEALVDAEAAVGADGGAGEGLPSSGGAAPQMLVHVVGEVREPGVVELPAGARVRDAVEEAGGATEAAVLAGVNLARLVRDGEQIVVPDIASAETGASGIGSGIGADAAGASGGLVPLNTADADALQTLPGVGPALARRIIDWREANGGFGSVEQLMEVSGIGTKTLEGFRNLVTL